MRRDVSTAEVREWVRLARDGWWPTRIAMATGRPQNTIAKHLRRVGAPTTAPHIARAARLRAIALRLTEAGWSGREIAAELGVSRRQVCRYRTGTP